MDDKKINLSDMIDTTQPITLHMEGEWLCGGVPQFRLIGITQGKIKIRIDLTHWRYMPIIWRRKK